jgi:hypothetical protein
MFRLNKIILLFFVLSLLSCVKNDTIDFTQVDKIVLHQQINGSLLNFNATLPDFADVNNLPFTTYEINTPLDAFNDAAIQSALQKVTFNFNFDNTFNRDFEFVFNFLDVNNNLVYSTTILVNKLATTNKDVIVEGTDLTNLKTAKNINIVVSLLNSTSIDNSLDTSLKINLNATLDLIGNQQVTASLISIDASLSDFTDVDNLPFTTFEFKTPLDAFNQEEVKNRLEKMAVHFEIENTFNRDFELVFEFLDSNKVVTYSIPINLNKTAATTFDQVIEGLDLENLKKSITIQVHASVVNATTIDNTPNAFINFKSSTTLFF